MTKPGYSMTRYYLGDYEEEVTGTSTRKIHYVSGGDGLAALYVQNNGQDSLYFAFSDFQGNLIALAKADGSVAEKYAYDPWGNRRNPYDWQQVDTCTAFIIHRGYTLHEHLDDFNLINMNGRMYDPRLGMFLSPDPYIQAPGDWLNYNRYTYGFNNPLMYVDPDGEIAWFIPVIIGAVAGSYMGGVAANDGQYNPTKWDYGSGKTWGYMLGGALIGGGSAYLGGLVAASGIPMANTAGIAVGSLVNSSGMYAITGGQVPISISFGAASYDFTNGEWGYLGKKGNKWYQNMAYSFGAMANLTDAITLFRGGGENINANSAKTSKEELWGHHSLTNESGEPLLSVGPDSQVQKAANLKETWQNSIKGADMAWDTYVGEQGTWSVKLNNVSTNAISKYASGVTRWDLLLNSCVGHTTRALWAAGVPTIYAFHPHMLNFQLLIRQIGIYSSPYLYQIP